MKKLLKFLLFAITLGVFVHVLAGEYQPVIDSTAPSLAFAAVAKKELREKELIKHFRHKGTWLEAVPSKNQWVSNDVIRINVEGNDPDVLINNNSYPINSVQRTDESIVVSLNKYDTTNIKVTDDEIYALPYDKEGSVQRQIREVLEEKTEAHALHMLAPQQDTAETPVVETTGPDDGTGRKRLVYDDLVNLKKKLDNMKVPKRGRVLVLSPDHIADLLIEDKKLEVQYQNHKEGVIAKSYAGFEVYESIWAPEYDGTTKTKIPFGSVTAGKPASVVFLKQATAKARGSVKIYMRDAKTDPENRASVIGARLYFVAVPLKSKGQAAIISG